MARTAITATTITGIDSNGYNLTDSSDFDTLSTGAANGVSFAHDPADVVILKNDTGGAAIFSLITGATGTITAIGGSVVDATVTVAAGKTHVLPGLPTVLKQTDGDAYIDCDVAGKILVLNK